MAEEQSRSWETVGLWALLIGGGAFFVLLLWVPTTWRGAAAVFVAAAVYFAAVLAVGLVLQYPWSDILRAWWWRLPIGIIAGLLAGLSWWLVTGHGDALVLALLIGAALGGLAAAFEFP